MKLGKNELKTHDEMVASEPKLISCKEKLEYAQPFFFMIWDGLGFFSTSGFHKLKRMADPKARKNWYDKYLTPQGYIFGIMYIIAIILVIVFEFSKYNSVSSTKVDLISEPFYQYHLNLGQPVIHGIWLKFDQLA